MIDAAERVLRDLVEKEPLDYGAAAALADYLKSRGRQEGAVIELVLHVLAELDRIDPTRVDEISEKRVRASLKRRGTNQAAWDEHLEFTITQHVEYRRKDWSRARKYLEKALRAEKAPGMKDNLTTAAQSLRSFVDGSGLSGELKDDLHATKAFGLLQLAKKAAKRPAGAPKVPTLKQQLVDALRKKFGDGSFTGKEAARAYFEVQKENGKNPGSKSAERGEGDYFYTVRPILQQAATPAHVANAIFPGKNSRWILKKDAEELVCARASEQEI